MTAGFAARTGTVLMLLTVLAGQAGAQDSLLKTGRGLLDSLLKPQSGQPAAGSVLSNEEISNGLREALRVGAERVIAQLAQPGGYLNDDVIHIPLPDSLKSAQATLDRVGLGALGDDLEQRLNRAAETAAPTAGTLFREAIAALTLDDVRAILTGPDDAATRYFRRHMSAPLADRMRPVVDQALSEVGALQVYENFISRYKSLPLVPDVRGDLTKHTLERALDGLFHYLAQEEAAIRNDPGKRTSALLQKVFAHQ